MEETFFDKVMSSNFSCKILSITFQNEKDAVIKSAFFLDAKSILDQEAVKIGSCKILKIYIKT